MMNRVMAYGWWQGRNFGDNWIAATLRKAFGDIGFMPTESVFEGCDFLIYGGGGLFMQELPPGVDKIPMSYGMLGIGAEFKTTNQAGVKGVVERSRFFFVRDRHTCDMLGLDPEKHLSADLTFYEPLYESSKWGDKTLFVWRKPSGILTGRSSFRDYIGHCPDDVFDRWMFALDDFNIVVEEFKDAGAPLVDYRPSQGVSTLFGASGCEIAKSLRDVIVVISCRYHGLVAAIQAGIPCIGIDVCPKIRALMNESGLGRYCLKIGEYDKVDAMMDELASNQNEIRSLQRKFTNKSRFRIRSHVEICQEEIAKVLNQA